MTTAAAEALYLSQHAAKWNDREWSVFNPHDKPIEELPVIYGFNNGGERGWLSGCLIAEDGTGLGGHVCSSEGYMLHDLGIVEGARPDRHEHFREHYPDGYRMAFVGRSDVLNTPTLMAAFEKNKALAEAAHSTETS